MKATEHPAYHDALGYAVTKARRTKGNIVTVYFDGAKMSVRDDGFRPEGAETVCIVQCYGEAIRMRFATDGTVDKMGRPRVRLPQVHRSSA
jgi:hypothetical protein